jgi:putative hemolysin
MEILIIIALVLLNGVFAMSELSLVSSRKFKLEAASKKGNLGAKKALELSENPTRFLSTVQIGITLIGILLGVYSGKNLTNDVEGFLVQFEFIKPYAKTISTPVIVVFVTYLSIVLGELFPKRLGMSFPEPIAIALARPMIFLSKITAPFVWLLTSSNDLLLLIFGIKKQTDSRVSEEEIKALIKESAERGEIQNIEQDIVERVFELGDRRINTLLTHRTELVYFNLSDSWETISAKINQEKHSAYPVCNNNNLDDIVGLVLLKDLFSPQLQSGFKLLNYLKKPLFINETSFAYPVLEIFKKEKLHYGIVIDEYGSTMGILTMDDVVDALVGDAPEFDQDENQITPRDEKTWLVDGQYSLIDFVKYFNLSISTKNSQFTTVAGLIIFKSSKVPSVGEKIKLDGYQLEVIDKDGQRIDKILVTKLT